MWISASSSRAGREVGASVRASVTRARASGASFWSCRREVAEAIRSGTVGEGSGTGSGAVGFAAKALEEKEPVELRRDFSRFVDLEAALDFRFEARCFAIAVGEKGGWNC